jgi:hypothetical protein
MKIVDGKKVATYPGVFVQDPKNVFDIGISYFNLGLFFGIGIPAFANKCRNEPPFRRMLAIDLTALTARPMVSLGLWGRVCLCLE